MVRKCPAFPFVDPHVVDVVRTGYVADSKYSCCVLAKFASRGPAFMHGVSDPLAVED